MRRVPLILSVAILFVPRAAWAQGGPLGPEFRVNTFTQGGQGDPSIAAGSAGNFVVVWSSAQGSPTWNVFGQRYDSSGTPLGPEFRVNTYTTQFAVSASVTVEASGTFVVVWEGYVQGGSGRDVLGQRYDSSGTPLGPEFRINTYTTSTQDYPSVAADASGNFVVVWQGDGQDGSNFGVFGQRYASSGTPLGLEFRVNTTTTSFQAWPSVAADSSGNFVVVWTSTAQYSAHRDVFGQRYDSSGTPLGPEFRVNTLTTDYQQRPSVAADPSGNFVVVWSSYSQYSLAGILGQRYASSGSALGPEFRVNAQTTGYQGLPSVARDASGNFVVVWQSYFQDVPDWGTFGQRFASSGPPSGPEFRVSTYGTLYQPSPAVATDSSGNFVVVWSSLQDDSGTDVFGQRYGQIVPVELMRFAVE